MAGNDIDSLLQSKAAGAKRGRIGLIAGVCAAVLGVVCAVAFGVAQNRSASAEGVQPAAVESPAAVETVAPVTESQLPMEESQPPVTETQPPESLSPVLYPHELRLVWLGEEQPEEAVRVEVLRGETLVDTLELGPENDWSARWENQYPTEELTLAGALPQGSDVSYALNGDSFVLTARLGQVVNVESDAGYLPKTGLRWTAVVLLALLACGCFTSYIIMKKNQA